MKVLDSQLGLFLDGKICSATGSRSFSAVNPSTGEPFATLSDATVQDMRNAIQAARQAFDEDVWSGMSVSERGIYLKKIAQLIRKEAKELARCESLDCGKTQKQSTFIDIPTAADTFDYFSDAASMLEPRRNAVDAPVESFSEREPFGVTACIIPWNYPLLMMAWKIAPALIAGNTVVLKPSPLGSVSVAYLAQLIEKIGLPKGVLNVVTSIDPEAASELVRSDQVDLVSFTGGTKTGEEVMKTASSTTKKMILELGGKSPNIVFADANRTAALGGTMSSIFMNQGQMCTAGSRLFIEESIYDEFLNDLIEKTKTLKIGNVDDYQTTFGPVISEDHRSMLLRAIGLAVEQGAEVVCGGGIPKEEKFKDGFYVEPTILTNVTNDMQICQEELFGPVLAVMKFKDEESVIDLANDTPYGLSATIWTEDKDKAKEMARKLKCGTVWINTYGGYYNQASYGGYKRSGFGRELGPEGLVEFTRTKHICVDETPGGVPLAASWF